MNQSVLEYLKQWLAELQDIDRPTAFEIEIKDQLYDRIVALEQSLAKSQIIVDTSVNKR